MFVRTLSRALIAAAAAGALWSSTAAAQILDRSSVIKVIVPYTAGGPTDITLRVLGQRIQAAGGPTIVVENRPGGGQVIGAMVVKDARPDGLTLFVADLPTFAINKTLMKELPFDPVTDFKPITTLFAFPSLLVVPAGSPAKTPRDLVDLAKKTPGGIPYASQGPGSGGQLLSEMFSKATGAPLIHIPYKGSAAAYPDVVAGRVSFIFGSYPGAKPFIEAGTMRALAVPSKQRLKAIPDVPTLAELGILDVDLDLWYGLVAPAGTPDAVIARLREMFLKEMTAPDMVARMDTQGMFVTTNTPAEFTDLIKKDIVRLKPIVEASGAIQ